jgi:enterochelin esterase-like enzyme
VTAGVPTAGTPKTRAAGPPRTPKHPREEIVESPAVARLRDELAAGDGAALERFWAQAAASGTPLLEDAEDGRITVTFLWRDRHGAGEGTSRVVLVANRLTDPSVMEDSVLHRLAGTDVWHRSYRLASSFRATYLLAPEDGSVPGDEFVWTGAAARWRGLVTAVAADPLNPLTLPERGGGHASIVALPDAPLDMWATPRPGVARGTVSEHHVDSAILGMRRRVWSYVPAGAGSEPPTALLVLFDGEEWVGRLDGPVMLDNLIAAGRIPPLVALMVEAISPRDRATDLTPGAPFASFVVDELLPWARENFGAGAEGLAGAGAGGAGTGAEPAPTFVAGAEPMPTFVAGQSLGGLAALSLAFEHPGRFAGVVAQSASVWSAPHGAAPRDPAGDCWAVERCAQAALEGLRVHLEVGTLEWVMVDDTRRLRDALARAGARVTYGEFAGGHEALCWRAGLADALAGVLCAGA